jgi:alcohol dehydrogenase class IV
MTIAAERPSHAVSFKGAVSAGWQPANARRLIIANQNLEPVLQTEGLAADAVAVLFGPERPDTTFVEELTRTMRQGQIGEVVAVGSGALLDAAKVARQAAVASDSSAMELLLVPCGPEPYRAVTGFAVVDDEDGRRPTTVDPRFATANVLLVGDLLAAVSPTQLAVQALDTAVQAIESLLSRQINPFARALAISALQTVAEEVGQMDAPTIGTRSRVTIASFLAAEAFTSTRLGIAHALASPLGAEVGITHDTINGVLGEPMVELWGTDVAGFADVAAACQVPPTLAEVLAVLARLREVAELPRSLAGLGIPWPAVEAVLPKAAKSSGMTVLARALESTTLEQFAQRAWRSAPDQEVVDARTA